MPTLLQINSVANIGSTGHIAEQIGKKVIADGWKSIISYGRAARDSQSSLMRIGNRFDVYKHALLSRFLDCQGLQSQRATQNFIKKIDCIHPDIVQIHNLHGHYINYPLLFKYLKSHNIPVVITLHDFWLITGHCAYINFSCDQWKYGCGKCPRLKSYPSSFIDRSRYNKEIKSEILNTYPDITLVPVSEWMNNIIKESSLNNIPRKVISNGIDTEQFYNSITPSEYINPDYFNILCVATRWTDSNGFDDILKLSELIDSKTRIIVVGVNPSQLKKLPANMIGILRTENISELRSLYSQADLFLNPNKEVTFGLVTAESMACGTPSIVYKNTAGEEIVGDNGFAIENITEVNAIVEYLRHNHIPKPDNECIKHIRLHYNVTETLENYLTLYRSLL